MVGMRVRGMFFDRAKVIRAVGRAKARTLSRAGAFVRTTAKRSIRNAPFVTRKRRGQERRDRRRKSSKPGNPPFSQLGTLRRLIFFAYERHRDTVVIGPARGGGASGAPSNLEYGGRTRIKRRGSRPRAVKIARRPYMGPALEKEQRQFAERMRDSVK